LRFVLTFFALFAPLAWLLWTLAGETSDTPVFEDERPEFGDQPVFDTSEIPQLPVRGEINRLEKGLFQRFHPEQEYVVYYVSFQGIERVGSKTRIVGISCAVFGEPEEGRENIRARMEAPYLEGDPVELIAAQREGARELVLGGGVKVYDELGRLMGELDSVTIDLKTDSIRSDGEVFFRSPEKQASVRGRGLVSNLDYTDAKLLKDVRARLPLGEDGENSVTLSCDGPAAVVRDDEKRTTTVTLRNGARIQHEDAGGTCESITAHLKENKKTGEMEVGRVVLEGKVDFELDAAVAEGLEDFEADRITIFGQRRILVEGSPVRAVRRGPLEVFGLADRVLDFDAPTIEILLRPDAKSRQEALESIRFPGGLNIADREGPGRLHAGWLFYDAALGQLEARKDVVASGVGRRLQADRIEMRRPPDRKDAVVVGIFGNKSLELRATGRLGPLVRGKENRYTFACEGPLYVETHDETTAIRASRKVRVKGRTENVLECDRVFAVILKKALRLVDAEGSIRARDPETGAKLRADQLNFNSDREMEIYLRGSPVVVEQPDRTVEAGVVTYKESGAFVAGGGIHADVTLEGGRWKFRAQDAEGIAPREPGPPPRFLAYGKVAAEGPKGARLEADRVSYVDETGHLTLKGSPARIRQGDELSYEGARLDLDIEQKDKQFVLLGARTAAARMVLAPKAKGGKKNRIARWEVDLAGDAWLEGDVVISPDSTAVRGYDNSGELVLKGRTDDLRVLIERTDRGLVPKKVICEKAVDLESFRDKKRDMRMVAKSMTYVVATRNLDLQGPGKLWRQDKKEPTLFSEAEFELLDDGVNLKYLGNLKVPE
jgi:lipopolysaccharide export system protein LptA